MIMPSHHTQLMNRVIGLCTKTKDYPSTFADHGYQVELIEQSIITKAGDTVKPDIVIASEKYRNIIAFDCKGGHSIDSEQLKRYQTLTSDDLSRWIRLHNSPVSHNLCYAFRVLQATSPVVSETLPLPLLIFGDHDIRKVRAFAIPDLDRAFEPFISLTGLHPPLSHYPFSEEDDDVVILPIVLRKLVELAFNKNRGGPSALEEATFDLPEIVESTHPYWDALSEEHRGRLKRRVKRIMKRLITEEKELAERIQALENREGYIIRAPLNQLQKIAYDIIERWEKQPKLNAFPTSESND
jgi:hypothetical protein